MTGAATQHLALAQQTGATRTELQRHDLSADGREVIQVRVDLEPGVTFPSHTHPGEEIIYVLEGAWELPWSADGPLRPLRVRAQFGRTVSLQDSRDKQTDTVDGITFNRRAD